MPAPALSKVDRVLYRTLQRLARTFDRHPALKALICRNLATPLPPALDGAVAGFLGSPDALYYWPAPVGQPQARVADAVRQAFRQPTPGSEQEGAFAATRYLTGLLAIARKHGMLSEGGQGLSAAASVAMAAEDKQQQQQQQQQQSAASSSSEASSSSSSSSSLEVVAAPERGNVLIAHPALSGIFGRSVVLLCSHEPHKCAYGLIVNKPLGTDLQHLYERLDQLQGGGGGPPPSGALGGLGAGGPSALFGLGGPAAPGAGGVLPSGSSSQEGMAAAAAAAAAGNREDDDDIPAESLQQMADYLDWRSRLGLAAPVPAAVPQQQPPEFDEYGNWLEPSSFEAFDQDSAAEEAGPFVLSDSEDEARQAFQEGLAASALGQEWSFGPGADPEGVAEALIEALRRAGGGTVVMCDSEGQLWSHHLPTEMASSEDDDEDDDMRSGSESDSDPFTGWVTAASLVDESPEAIADLILSSLTPQDRLLLQRQAELAAEAAQAPAALSARSSGGSSAGGSGGSSGSSRGSTAVHTSQKVQRIQQVVDHLIATASAELQRKAAAEQLAQQQGEQQRGEQQQMLSQQAQQQQQAKQPGVAEQPGEAQRQEWLQQLEDLTPSGAAGRMAAGSLGWRAGEHVLGGPAGAAGAAGEPSGSGAKGGTAHTVTQLMGLFEASPLFRGGPMPGVQVLHRRPKLGGMLVLPPWGSGGAAAEAAEATAVAVEDAAAGAGQPGGEALEGGLFVGADLTQAQELLDSGYLSPGDVRVVLGDSGWVPQQLEGEVARGTWAVARVAPDFLDLFSPVPPSQQPAEQPPEGAPGGPLGATFAALDRSAAAVSARVYEDRMWSKCLSALGPECAAMASVPRGVWQDIEQLEV